MFQSEQAQLQFKSPVALGRLSPVTHARITKSQKEAAEMLKTKEVSIASKKRVLTAKCVYRIFPKYGLGVNYFQMSSDQALN